jgi:thiol-disulfide isomerase/thioredoxin
MKIRKRALWIVAIIMAFIAGFFIHKPLKDTYYYARRRVNIKKYKDEMINSSLYSKFDIDQLLDFHGNKIQLEKNEKTKLLYIWSPHCKHCENAVNTITLIEAKYNVVVYGIPMSSSREPVLNYIEEKEIIWTQIWGNENDEDNYEIFNFFSVPEVWVVDNDDTLIDVRIGSNDIEKIIIDNHVNS